MVDRGNITKANLPLVQLMTTTTAPYANRTKQCVLRFVCHYRCDESICTTIAVILSVL